AFDKVQGIKSGNRVANFIFEHFLRPRNVAIVPAVTGGAALAAAAGADPALVAPLLGAGLPAVPGDPAYPGGGQTASPVRPSLANQTTPVRTPSAKAPGAVGASAAGSTSGNAAGASARHVLPATGTFVQDPFSLQDPFRPVLGSRPR